MADSPSSHGGWLPPRPPGEPERPRPAQDAGEPPRFAPPAHARPARSPGDSSRAPLATGARGPGDGDASAAAGRPRFVKPARRDRRAPASGLSIGSAVLAVLSLLLLVFTLGLSAIGSMALSAAAWALAALDRRRARENDPQAPAPARAGRLLGMLGIVLSAIALIVWSVLIAQGGSPEGLLEQLREQLEEIERRQQSAPAGGQGDVEV